MDATMRVLMVNAGSGFYRMKRYRIGDFFGPVDLGLHLSAKYDSLNIGTGLLAGSIFPGSNRLVFTGLSPCWGGFYISSMGGAGLIFDNLGINLLSLTDCARTPSVLVLNRDQGEDVEVELLPLPLDEIWRNGRGGTYAMLDWCYEKFAGRYHNDPRILVTGPAARATDCGGIVSVPVRGGALSHTDTWAGRGGLGSKLFQKHGIAAIVYGGSFVDEDFRDRNVADGWFKARYNMKLMAKDVEATTKYRFNEKLQTGGTFGVNYATLKGRMLSFNYRSIYWDEARRLQVHTDLVLNHYLKQFNDETIEPRQQTQCGEPCPAVCKKMNGHFKKDFEPYQTLGPLSGIFDQRAAETVNRRADTLGFDAISIGGVVSWLMECLAEGQISCDDLGVTTTPIFDPENFAVVEDSARNASIAVEILDGIIEKRGILDLSGGARKFARRLSRDTGEAILSSFVYNSFGRNGWMVPNQYWTPGVLSPMAIMGKYYMHYGSDFLPPRYLGRVNAERFEKELRMDNLGICRFHRGWAEEMGPEIIESLWGLKDAYLQNVRYTATRINSRNASQFWESSRCTDYVHRFLCRKRDVEGETAPELLEWIDRFEKDSKEAGLAWWYEMHKGMTESLREFN